MIRKKLLRAAVPAFLVMLLAAPALHAVPIYAPQVVVPEAYPDPGEVAVLDRVEGTFSLGAMSGRYEQGVFVDPFGKTCAGCLDFFLRVELDAGNILTLDTGLFPELASVTLDLGYITGTGKAPVLASRNELGTIHYFFGNQILSGESSAYLVVATNATEYERTGGFLINGSLQQGDSWAVTGLFGPVAATPVPEPGTLVLIAMGIAGLLFIRRRRLAAE